MEYTRCVVCSSDDFSNPTLECGPRVCIMRVRALYIHSRGWCFKSLVKRACARGYGIHYCILFLEIRSGDKSTCNNEAGVYTECVGKFVSRLMSSLVRHCKFVKSVLINLVARGEVIRYALYIIFRKNSRRRCVKKISESVFRNIYTYFYVLTYFVNAIIITVNFKIYVLRGKQRN